jgi:hypothetical protein
MASKLEFIKSVTGSATNTLGTLGRSIFNSTLGAYADSDTMNQIYSAVDKLTNSIETTSKTIDNEALNGRNKADDLYSLIAGMDIKSSYDFMNKNREFMKRLMRLNKQERDITLDAIGVDVSGKSNVITNEHVKDYDHVKGNNYLEDYVKTLPQNQQIGDETTMLQLESTTHKNFSGIHNELYTVSENLYPDEGNKGAFSNKWIVENKNSLMYKTKKLFNSKKIGTIISSFHTDPNRSYSSLDNAKSKYGLSRGRNLLNKRAENGANSSYVNGYDNPYCRVWTHHHQYDRLYKSTRPFSSVDNQGNYSDTMGLKEFHQFPQFSDKNDNNESTKGKWGWKKDSNNGWQYSVLQDNGKVNITPKYIRGEASNIHTKQCMFSIENLAWRGYDPYSFEQALSWEQRGPLGGRIMWFPPYGIQFQETTSTQWTNNTFLGRGEDVYTYTNTTRTGSLSFMMVVDHPSIIDYVTWTNANKNVTDTDILRFFAGCGEGDGTGLRQYAKPTPVTDEYTQIHSTTTAEEEVKKVETKNPETTKPTEQVISFYVFYPNNYSGTYDDRNCGGGEGYKIDSTSKVEAIPYLLNGQGAEKNNTTGSVLNVSEPFMNDSELTEDVSTWGDSTCGYEMGGNGISDQNVVPIYGTSLYPNTLTKTTNTRRKWTNLGTSGHPRTAKYSTGVTNPVKNAKQWYYRIDGRYAYPQSTAEEKIHYYNQTLEKKPSYRDTQTFELNKNISSLQETFSDEISVNKNTYVSKSNSNSNIYTLAEMAYALYNKNSQKQSRLGLSDNITNSDRIKKLIDIIEHGEVISIGGVGYASKQGYTELNEALGKNRFYTAAHWFMKHKGCESITPQTPTTGQDTVGITTTTKGGEADTVRNNESVKGDSNTKNAKKWRYARVDITIKTTETVNSAESANTTTSENANANAVKNKNSSSSTDSSNEGTNTQGGSTSTESNATSSEQTKTDGGTADSTKTDTKNDGSETKTVKTGNLIDSESVVYSPTGESGYCSTYNKTCKIYKDSKGKKWYRESDESNNLCSVEYASEVESVPQARYGNGKTDENRLRYDQEYHFFKVLKQEDPIVFNSLMDKLQYFDPAFHSMTPEGFNGRLTFLQQCMRQGNTVSASDGKFEKSANNLAFGRAPYCVLRLGDFYNQMIVIDNLSISYDPLVWDLNVEGIGVQPLIANVQLSFKFIGGGDLTGPVRRLQNAMSFNYYANARLYDNRADRIERRWSDKTCGAIEHDEILSTESEEKKGEKYSSTYNPNGNMSSFYTTQMAK